MKNGKLLLSLFHVILSLFCNILKINVLVPELPRNVVTSVQGPTAIRVNLTKPAVQPGNTTYIIKAYEVLEGTYTYVKDISVNGWYLCIAM